ncbi:hypothetical protein BpHYR1_002674 [Brachionus plicatilis]|uniref:Uncharacterized protein n=1 Tax=Brachionus plicatilis TaxID=10195 RepID=A0A3M7R7Q9_BRAPC|nr:hypothetical protein BpHYR1_002674 [Brachionus plicatilis]
MSLNLRIKNMKKNEITYLLDFYGISFLINQWFSKWTFSTKHLFTIFENQCSIKNNISLFPNTHIQI